MMLYVLPFFTHPLIHELSLQQLPTVHNTVAHPQIYHHHVFHIWTLLTYYSLANPEAQAIHYWDPHQEFSNAQTFP
jgi:hypothetical protein